MEEKQANKCKRLRGNQEEDSINHPEEAIGNNDLFSSGRELVDESAAELENTKNHFKGEQLDDSPGKHEIIASSLIKRKNPPRAPAERVRTPTTVSESRRHLER